MVKPYDYTKLDEIILFKHPTDEIYDVTVYSCSDVAYNFIRIPTEYYCGEKVYPRTIKDISDYSYYEKLCVREIIKYYNTDLKDKIFELNDDNEKLGKKFEKTQTELEEVRTKAAENDSTNTNKSNLIKKYIMIQGNTHVRGPGIMIRYYPSDTRKNGENVTNGDITKDIVDIVNELKNAGAEAVAVNDIRMTATSSIEMEKNNIVIDGERIARPYVIRQLEIQKL